MDMKVRQTDKEIDSIYESRYQNKNKFYYTAYMTKNIPIICLVDLSSWQIIDSRNGFLNANIRIKAISKSEIDYNGSIKLMDGVDFVLIAPKLTFVRMFHDAKVDIRDEKYSGLFYMSFIIKSRRKYKLLSLRRYEDD